MVRNIVNTICHQYCTGKRCRIKSVKNNVWNLLNKKRSRNTSTFQFWFHERHKINKANYREFRARGPNMCLKPILFPQNEGWIEKLKLQNLNDTNPFTTMAKMSHLLQSAHSATSRSTVRSENEKVEV